MSDTSLAPRVLAALAAVTILAGIAAPIHAADEVAVQADTLEDEAGTLESLTEGAGDEVTETVATTADGAQDAISAAGDVVAAIANTLAQGALAVTDALQATAHGLASAAAWTASATGAILAATGTGLAWAARGLGEGIVWTATALGGALATAGAWTASALLDAARWTGAAWPTTATGQALVAGTASGSAAAAGTAWYTRAWRYLKYVPGLAPLYSRIQPEELLEHPKRDKLYTLIKENPGIHLSQMSREMDVSWGTLVHHLRKLEKGDLITSEDKRGKRCFFVPGQITGAKKDILPALENEKARRIAEYYADNPGASQSDAADALDYSAALVSWHLKNLEDAGVVTREREGRRQRVGVTQEARSLVAAA